MPNRPALFILSTTAVLGVATAVLIGAPAAEAPVYTASADTLVLTSVVTSAPDYRSDMDGVSPIRNVDDTGSGEWSDGRADEPFPTELVPVTKLAHPKRHATSSARRDAAPPVPEEPVRPVEPDTSEGTVPDDASPTNPDDSAPVDSDATDTVVAPPADMVAPDLS